MDRAIIIILRARDTENIDGTIVAVPTVPVGWVRKVQWQPRSNHCWVYLRDSQNREYWWRTLIDGVDVGYPTLMAGMGCAVDPANNAVVKNFAQASNNAWTLAELIADNSAVATTLKAAWKELASSADGDTEPNGQPIIQSTIAGFDFKSDSKRFSSINDI